MVNGAIEQNGRRCIFDDEFTLQRTFMFRQINIRSYRAVTDNCVKFIVIKTPAHVQLRKSGVLRHLTFPVDTF